MVGRWGGGGGVSDDWNEFHSHSHTSQINLLMPFLLDFQFPKFLIFQTRGGGMVVLLLNSSKFWTIALPFVFHSPPKIIVLSFFGMFGHLSTTIFGLSFILFLLLNFVAGPTSAQGILGQEEGERKGGDAGKGLLMGGVLGGDEGEEGGGGEDGGEKGKGHGHGKGKGRGNKHQQGDEGQNHEGDGSAEEGEEGGRGHGHGKGNGKGHGKGQGRGNKQEEEQNNEGDGAETEEEGVRGHGKGRGKGNGKGQGGGLLDGVTGTVGGVGKGVGKALPPGQLKKLINGVAESFYAPDPNSDIPPHVLRRIMRFCTKHPDHQKCKDHPEWVIDQGVLPELAGATDEVLKFPKKFKFKIRGVPKVRLKYLLEGVPAEFVKGLPPGLAKKLDPAAIKTILGLCGGESCKKQKPEYLNQRASLAELESVILKGILPAKAMESIDNDIEVRQTRVYEVKKTLAKLAGLEGQVDPANDGVFQYDILLTETQADALINQLQQTDQNYVAIPERPPDLVPSDGVPAGDAEGPTPLPQRAKRAGNSLFLEMNGNERWPTDQPIQFAMHSSLDESDKGAVRAAIREIQSKSCIRFTEVPTSPPGNHLLYIKYANPAFCGNSYVGRVSPANPIYLSFLCGNAVGVAVHETLHALGLQHEQIRPDRDNFITINWNNMDPQRFDMFALSPSNKFTSYGIQYDFGSVMHYDDRIAARQFGLKTMTAKMNPEVNDDKMGQREGMAQSDVIALQRMYCKPNNCADQNVYCGVWATQQLCYYNGQPHGWMAQNCRKSCAFC